MQRPWQTPQPEAMSICSWCDYLKHGIIVSMPTYVYYNCDRDGTQERNVPMDERDEQKCEVCGDPLTRKQVFTGLTWAPTAGGMR